MEYNKPPLTYSQQAEHLLDRGMEGDRDLMVQRLQSVSYYRLSGYWFPFRQEDNLFKPGVAFETIWERYIFDRRLRILVMDAIERIEVAIRSRIAHHHAFSHGAFGYATDSRSLPNLCGQKRDSFLERIKEEQQRSQETFVEHFKNKYSDSHNFLPIWMAMEVMTFGSVLTFYRGVSPDIQKQVANFLEIPDVVLNSWLLTLNTVRNICAHHGRLWNRELGIKPKLPYPRKYPEWHFAQKVSNSRIFVILLICKYCLSIIAPQSQWPTRLQFLLKQNPNIPHKSMGFPDNWIQLPEWCCLEDTKSKNS